MFLKKVLRFLLLLVVLNDLSEEFLRIMVTSLENAGK